MCHCHDICHDMRAAGGGAGMCILAADMQVYMCDCVHSCRCEHEASDHHVGRRSDRPSEGGGECHSYQNLEDSLQWSPVEEIHLSVGVQAVQD